MSDYGKETVVLVEIDQPLCSRQYGDAFLSPSGGCQAVLGSSGTRKCYNTRFTCQDPANYDPGTLTLRFGRNQERLLRYYDNVLGAIAADPETTPAAINLGGVDPNMGALGQREVVALLLEDFQHSDLLVDKYRLERATGAASSESPAETFNPYTRGTFWGKWLARNPYYSNYPLRVREGFMGDALEDMRVRHYLIDRIEGPAGGQVKLVAKDIFAKVEAQKAVAPRVSRGSLAEDLVEGSPSPTTFSVTPTGIGDEDYDPAGHVRIGQEIIQYTRSGDVFTIVLRAALNTELEDHDEEDAVQQVLRYTSQLAVNITHDLLCNYTPLGAAGSPTQSDYINKSEWDAAAADLTELYTATIATPTPVKELVGELMVQAGFTIWPDVEEFMIRFKALRAGTSAAVIDDDAYIVEGSLSLRRQVERRLSQVWVYYAQIDPTKSLDERSNFRSVLADPDLEAESETQYGAPAIKEVFSRWIPQFGRESALLCAERLLTMFRDPPTQAAFSLVASHLPLASLAGYITLRTADVQDESGAQDEVQHAITEVERGENELAISSQSVVFYDPGPRTNTRTIPIENDDYNLNLREIHDLIYDAPAGGSPTLTVRFIVEANVVIGSLSSALLALTRGVWPSGVVVELVNHGRIQGKGGGGGRGTDNFGEGATDGETGGDALDCADGPITIDNTDGEIWAGGGGGGGGNGKDVVIVQLSGGGGGGAGTDGGVGGAGSWEAGANGQAEEGGAGGAPAFAARGGNGGAPGVPGTAGGSFGGFPPGNGGATGDYIVGNANVTWTALGDVRGGVS